jgi:hypothetical protein
MHIVAPLMERLKAERVHVVHPGTANRPTQRLQRPSGVTEMSRSSEITISRGRGKF